jgi:hypothetical protein
MCWDSICHFSFPLGDMHDEHFQFHRQDSTQTHPIQYLFEMVIHNPFLLRRVLRGRTFQHFLVKCCNQSARFHSCSAASCWDSAPAS